MRVKSYKFFYFLLYFCSIALLLFYTAVHAEYIEAESDYKDVINDNVLSDIKIDDLTITESLHPHMIDTTKDKDQVKEGGSIPFNSPGVKLKGDFLRTGINIFGDDTLLGSINAGYRPSISSGTTLDLHTYGTGIGTRAMIPRPYNGQIYVGLSQTSGVCKLARFNANAGITGLEVINCPAGFESDVKAVAMDYTNGYFYAVDISNPAKIAKCSAGTTFECTQTMTLSSGEYPKAIVIDEENNLLYTANSATTGEAVGKVFKVDTVTMTEIDSFYLSTGENEVNGLLIDKELGYLYLTLNNTTKGLVRVGLDPFVRIGVLNIGNAVVGMCYDSNTKILYSTNEATPSILSKTNLRDWADGSDLTITGTAASAYCILPPDNRIYIPSNNNATVKVVDLNTWKQVSGLTGFDSLDGTRIASYGENGYVYFGGISTFYAGAVIESVKIANFSFPTVTISALGYKSVLIGKTGLTPASDTNAILQPLLGDCANTALDTGDEVCAVLDKICQSSFIFTDGAYPAKVACNTDSCSSGSFVEAFCY